MDHSTIQTQFQRYYQTTVQEMQTGHPQFANMPTTALINIQTDAVLARVSHDNPSFSLGKCSVWQKEALAKAIAQQLFYVLTEGDFGGMSGYDPMTNTYAERRHLDERAISKRALQTLEQAGLLYRGLSSGSVLRPGYRGWEV